MKHPARLLSLLFSVLVLTALVGPAAARRSDRDEHGSRPPTGNLQMYTATVDGKQLQELVAAGTDIASIEETLTGFEVDLVLFREERDLLAGKGLDLMATRNEDGLTALQAADAQAAATFTVWRPWDGPGNIEEEILALDDDPKEKDIAVYDIGDTHQGRDILAVRLTHNAKKEKLGKRPAVLYQGTTHAREWISTEVTRRLMHWFIDHQKDKEIKKILDHNELWFVPVVNPDGYQYTFDGDRLWRKNLRDNDGDDLITNNDGVDVNRNYPEHWNYDEEGSSSQFSSQTYRGPAPGSEPETMSSMTLFGMADLQFAISYHSFGNLLLYPQGWQVQTPSADDPIYLALTGTDDDPAIPGYNPGVGADLYTTNGEFTDWAHGEQGVLAWTPELPEGCEDCGFVYPDDEAAVQGEFEANLPFALNVARSAEDPDDPASHWGMDTQDLYLDLSEVDPWKAGNPASDLALDVSYAGGSSQWVEVLAKGQDKDVKLTYMINGGKKKKIKTTESPEGERFGGNNAYDRYYHYVGGSIPGLAMGDSVEYWFTEDKHGKSSTEHITFDVVEDADADVLILAAEDRTGASNFPAYGSVDPGTPNFLDSYTTALTGAGHTYDVYDVDEMGRQAPDHLGVLSHYDAVIWYTGNDLVTREPGWGGGNVSRLAVDMVLEVRQFLNEGGKLLYTGPWAGATENGALGGPYYYDPTTANEQCRVAGGPPLPRCLVWSDKNDFIQYYLGAFIYNTGAGWDEDADDPHPVDGIADPYTGIDWTLDGADSAMNHAAHPLGFLPAPSFITTGSILPEADYPQFTSDAPAVWETGVSGPFEPIDGDWYMHSDRADISYKRLSRTINLETLAPGAPATLTFKTSYDTEPDWDFLFVEAHTVDEDDWTTLPDTSLGLHTSMDTGLSCPEGWYELHPWLERYQGEAPDCPGMNAETGGEWNAASGRSSGWEEWVIDLSGYSSKKVELSISYVSDWGVQGLGVFVDDIIVSTGEGTTSFEADADPMDGWAILDGQPGSAPNPNNWYRTESVGFEEGAVVSTEDSLYFGFGFEGISDAAKREDVIFRSLEYLIP